MSAPMEGKIGVAVEVAVEVAVGMNMLLIWGFEEGDGLELKGDSHPFIK